MKKIFYIMLVPLLVTIGGCESFLDQQPISDLSTEKFWRTEDDAKTGMAGVYSAVQTTMSGGYIEWGEARSDNFTFSGTGEAQVNLLTNALNSSLASSNWSNLYETISRANFAIKYIPGITGLSEINRNHYLAQAYAIRSFMYFYAIRVWGNVPLWLEPYEDVTISANLPRTSAEEILNNVIIPDLIKAQSLANPSINTVWEVNTGATLAMLTDVYMWKKDYPKALEASGQLLQLGQYSLAPTAQWKSLFLDPASTRENIWSLNWNYLQDGSSGNVARAIGVSDADAWYIPDDRVKALFQSNYRDIRTSLTYDSTETGGGRKTGKYVEKGANGKFVYPRNAQSQYKLVMYRLADILLLRAEALNMTNNRTEAVKLLNDIRLRANLPAVEESSLANQQEVETAILNERQKELFAEGRRWFDLVRTGRVLPVMDPVIRERQTRLGMTPTGFDNPEKILFPLHRVVLTSNPLLTQNPSYSE